MLLDLLFSGLTQEDEVMTVSPTKYLKLKRKYGDRLVITEMVMPSPKRISKGFKFKVKLFDQDYYDLLMRAT